MPAKFKSTNISLDEALWERANILAVRKRVSFTELVRQSLIHYCNGDHVDSITIDESGKVFPVEAESKLRGIRNAS